MGTRAEKTDSLQGAKTIGIMTETKHRDWAFRAGAQTWVTRIRRALGLRVGRGVTGNPETPLNPGRRPTSSSLDEPSLQAELQRHSATSTMDEAQLWIGFLLQRLN